MPADPLATAWHKYNWARKHLQAVDAALGRSLDPNVNPVTFKADVKRDRRVAIAIVRISSVPTIRDDVGLALGDVINNFRAALDHLAWGLVRAGTDPRPKKPRSVYFPFADNWGEFRGRINSWLPGVPDEYRAIVRRYQPYGRGDRAKAMRWLGKFSNMDKHRVLIPTVVNHSRIDCRVIANRPTVGWVWLARKPRALNVGTPVVRVTFAADDRTECEVQVEGQAVIHPSLGYGVPLADALLLIEATVRELLATFDQLL
jgi:hypothetical protein